MSDIFKKISEVDQKGIGNNDAFISMILEDYKKYSDMLRTISSTEREHSFSSDEDKFNEDCSAFISYLRECSQNEGSFALYMERIGNVIRYGRYDHGIKIEESRIEMISDEDLRRLYELMQDEFPGEFVEGCRHTFGKGWTLNPMIGENIMMDIDSNSSNDSIWFFEETHKGPKNDSPKKKIN